MSFSGTFGRITAEGTWLRKPESRPGHTETDGTVCSPDDEAAMGLIQRGNRDALGLLFDRHSRLILKIGTRILRDPEEAQDLVQEVFLYVHRRSHAYDSAKASVASWLIQVTYSRAFTRRGHLSARAKADWAFCWIRTRLATTTFSIQPWASSLQPRESCGSRRAGVRRLGSRSQVTWGIFFGLPTLFRFP